jgi:chlorophyllide a reductase subunit X
LSDGPTASGVRSSPASHSRWPTRPPQQPAPLSQDGLLELFDGDTVGRNVVLQPATIDELCSVEALNRPSLEVVYDDV